MNFPFRKNVRRGEEKSDADKTYYIRYINGKFKMFYKNLVNNVTNNNES